MFDDALHGRDPRYVEWLDVVQVPTGRRRGITAASGCWIELYDTTLRDGMQGEGMSLSAQEKLRVAHRLDELGIDLIEAGFPSSNPKELELFELLARRARSTHAPIAAFGMTRRRDVRGRRRPGAAGARRLLRAGVHAGRQDLGACTWRRWSRSTARRTCG